jgi:hypothetical protein
MRSIYIRVYTNSGFFDMAASALDQLKTDVLANPNDPSFKVYPLSLGGVVTYRTDKIEGWEEMESGS